jgi:hypothetical protein
VIDVRHLDRLVQTSPAQAVVLGGLDSLFESLTRTTAITAAAATTTTAPTMSHVLRIFG